MEPTCRLKAAKVSKKLLSKLRLTSQHKETQLKHLEECLQVKKEEIRRLPKGEEPQDIKPLLPLYLLASV